MHQLRCYPLHIPCDGEDKSHPLEIHWIDNSISKTLGLIMNDPDSPGGNGFVHWIMWNMELVSILPEDVPKTLSVTSPIGAHQGMNNYGRVGYPGPCPPAGQTHRYDFKAYGLDTILPQAPGSGKDEFVKAMAGHGVQFGGHQYNMVVTLLSTGQIFFMINYLVMPAR